MKLQNGVHFLGLNMLAYTNTNQSIFLFFLPLGFIETLPLSNTPEVFGLHPNAEIGYYTNAAKEMWSHLVELQPQTGMYGLEPV